MGISYDSANKKWNIEYEKNDHPIVGTVSITRPVQVVTWVNIGRGSYPRVENVDKTATVDVNGGYWDVINALNAAGIPNPKPWKPENA